MKFEFFEDALIENPVALRDWVMEWTQDLKPRQVILFEAELGMGKTTLTQQLIHILGGDAAPSPTYSVINEYQTSVGVVHHLDLYRVESEQDLDSTGFWDLFESKKGLIVIEWSERLDHKQLPRTWTYWKISIEQFDERFRKFTLYKCEPKLQSLSQTDGSR